MSNKTVTEVVELTDHPMEDMFGVEPNSTEIIKYEQQTELVEAEDYDDKDNEIESNFQEIYDKAISGYENLQETVEDIEPKYAARTHEVANQLLGTALQAAKEKANIKQHKDKIAVVKSKLNTKSKTVNNTIIMDTNSLIQHIKNANSAPIEQAPIAIQNKTDE